MSLLRGVCVVRRVDSDGTAEAGGGAGYTTGDASATRGGTTTTSTTTSTTTATTPSAARVLSAPFSVDACRVHGSKCKALTIGADAERGVAVLHDWGYNCTLHAETGCCDISFNAGFDNYVATITAPLAARLAEAARSLRLLGGQPGVRPGGSIAPSRFYSGCRGGGRGVAKAFHRQEGAFQYCDGGG
jgi:hypothetical protein